MGGLGKHCEFNAIVVVRDSQNFVEILYWYSNFKWYGSYVFLKSIGVKFHLEHTCLAAIHCLHAYSFCSYIKVSFV